MRNVLLHHRGCLAVLLVLVVALSLSPREKTVYLNMKQVIAVPVQLAAKQMSKATLHQFVTDYSHALPKTIAAYGKQHHVTMVAGALLYDTQHDDITGNIIQANLARLGAQHASIDSVA